MYVYLRRISHNGIYIANNVVYLICIRPTTTDLDPLSVCIRTICSHDIAYYRRRRTTCASVSPPPARRPPVG